MSNELRITLLSTLLLCACPSGSELEPAPAVPPTPPIESPCDAPCTTPSSASIRLEVGAEVLATDPEQTRDNPLRGFITSYLWSEPFNTLPDQMEFFYVPMAAVWGADGETFDSGLEPDLAAAAGRGHHSVIRIFIEYPGNPSALPGHLAGVVPCDPYEEFGGGCSPDWDDPTLVEAMVGLVEALGNRYDGDPRLGFLQLGLVGFWGEWHTWPHPEWFASEETQRTLLDAYDRSFQTTQLQMRLPYADAIERPIGFHDDSFAYSTIGDVAWFFVPTLESSGASDRWQEVPIGGELRPELQDLIFEDSYEIGLNQQDFDACVEATHASYLLNYRAFSGAQSGYVGEELERAEAAALRLGYRFELAGASLAAEGLLEDTVEVRISIELSQTGVAPFYYPLHLTLTSDALPEPIHSDEDLRSLLPGETRSVVFDLGRVPLEVLARPMDFSLESSMLLQGQRIVTATTTPWDEPGTGFDRVEWTLGCETESGVLPVGAVSGATVDGCACRCDVDGTLRACGLEGCE